MAVIGTFKRARDGGWEGSIRTLVMNAKLRLVPNDDQVGEHSPAFRVMLGWQRIGEAWEARSEGKSPREYMRIRIDDPAFHRSLNVALFPDVEGLTAQLIWRRSA